MFIAFACALWLCAFIMSVWVAVSFSDYGDTTRAKEWSKFHFIMAVASSFVAVTWGPAALGLTLLSAIFTGLFLDALSSAYLVIPLGEYFSYLETRYGGSNSYFIKGSLKEIPSGMPWRLQKEAADTGIKILKRFDEMGYKSRMYVGWLPVTKHVRFDRVRIDGDRVHYKIAILSKRGSAVPDGVSIDDLVSEEICGRLSAALDLDITGLCTPEGAWITVHSFFSSIERKKRKNNIGLFDTKPITALDRAFTAGFNSAMTGDLVFDDEPIEDAIERLQERRR